MKKYPLSLIAFLFTFFPCAIAKATEYPISGRPAEALSVQKSTYPTIISDYQAYYGFDEEEALLFEDMAPVMRNMLKHWVMYYQLGNDEYVNHVFSIEPKDSIVEGRTYALVVLENSKFQEGIVSAPADTLLFREEGNRVFCLPKGLREEVLLLDFNLHDGDTFTNSQGTSFVVESTGNTTAYEQHGRKYWKLCDGCQFYGDREPKILHLVSEDGNIEDTWIEGIGSTEWGIVPLYLVASLSGIGEKPVKTHVVSAPSSNIDAAFPVDENICKLSYFEPSDCEKDPTGYSWKYAFSDDTLCIEGLAELNCYTAYAECNIDGNDVSVKIGQFPPMGDISACKNWRLVNARIPGFKAGTYEVGLAGEEHVTLVCKGQAPSDYHPFIEEGKVWTTGRFPYGDVRLEPFSISTFQFEGDTIVLGRTCKRWVKRTQTTRERGGKITTDFVLPIYEEGRKVWFFCPGDDEPKLLYDFNVGKHSVSLFNILSSLATEYYLWDVRNDTMGLRRYYFRIAETDPEYGKGDEGQTEDGANFWVEGIGTLVAPDYNGPTDLAGNTETLLECRVGKGTILYKNGDWNYTGITEMHDNQESTTAHGAYDLTGRPTGQAQHGIVVRDGKKILVK